MIQPRVSVMTLNLWREYRWQERKDAVKQCLETFHPDILCLQELQASTRDHLDALLPGYSRVDDEHPGWECEGNIYWRDDLFREVEHGAADIGHLEQHRQLFWVRLELENETDRTVLVSTAHFTPKGREGEFENGQSPRIDQASRTVDVLDDLSRDREPVLFMGDLNDPVYPNRVLSEAGYIDCFSELSLPVPPTFPAWPTKSGAESIVERPLDWIFANSHAQSITATVPEFYHDDLAPSDHWPVLTMYELNDK